MKFIYIFVFIVLFIVSISSNKPIEKVESQISNNQMFDFVVSSQKVTITPVYPTGFVGGGSGEEYLPMNREIELTVTQIERLQNLLLSSKNFMWNKTKQGLFLPDFMLHFEKDEGLVIVLISTCLNQIQIIEGQNKKILDYDPMKQVFHDLLNEFTKGYSDEGT